MRRSVAAGAPVSLRDRLGLPSLGPAVTLVSGVLLPLGGGTLVASLVRD